MSLLVDLLDGSNTTNAPRADASAANSRMPRDSRFQEKYRRAGEHRLDLLHRVDRDCLEGRQPSTAVRARPGEPMARPTIPFAPDFLNDHGRVGGGERSWPSRGGLPSASCPPRTRSDCHNRRSFVRWGKPSHPRYARNGQHVCRLCPTCPGADGSVRIGADDQTRGLSVRTRTP